MVMLPKCFSIGLETVFLKSYKRYSQQICKMSSGVISGTLKRTAEDSEGNEPKKSKVTEEQLVSETLPDALKTSNRLRKPKKVALLLCYQGKNYFGMQRNTNVSTVEEELFKALLEAKIILQPEFDFPKTMKFQRAARTDKGVSAARQLVSLKLPLEEISNELAAKVNKYLPPEVRILGVKRATQSFNAKIACDARTYAYMLPTFAFSVNNEETSEEYRITEERISEVNKFLKFFLGTHNFYNFTSGRLPGDPSCNRYIISLECGLPFESCGLEFSVIKVKGQSFMLHQIRKMVGLAIAYMRNLADETVLKKAFLHERIDIPKAPGLGLTLEELHYDWYNKKYGSDGIHDALKWDEFDDVVNAFKQERICACIAQSEREEKSMLQWLETLSYHTYDVREAGPPGAIPTVSKESEKIETSDTVSI